MGFQVGMRITEYALGFNDIWVGLSVSIGHGRELLNFSGNPFGGRRT